MIPAFLIELPLRQGWDEVERLREATLVCLDTVTSDVGFRDQLGMVVGELLENAVKYGDWSNPGSLAHVRISGSAAQVEISVIHPIAPDTDVSPLMLALERIRAAPSPLEAYVSRMHEIAERSEHSGGSGGLGLVRIAFEANCTLAAERQGASLRVSAITRPPEGEDAHLRQ